MRISDWSSDVCSSDLGRDIPDHDTRPEFDAPKVFWNPVISPSSLLIYSGAMFPDWQGDAFIGGLSSQAPVRVEFDGDSAREAQRFDMGARIRAVEQGPDGAIWLLEDGEGGRLLKPPPKPYVGAPPPTPGNRSEERSGGTEGG